MAAARARPPATFLRGMARVGWRSSRSPSAEPELRPAWRPRSPPGRIDVEGVAHHGGRDPPFGQLPPAQLVDGDVDPGRVVGGRWVSRRSAPVARAGRGGAARRGRPRSTRATAGRRRRVEGQANRGSPPPPGRRPGRASLDLGVGRGFGGVDGQAGQEMVDRACPGHRPDVEAELRRGPSATSPPPPTPRRSRRGGRR